MNSIKEATPIPMNASPLRRALRCMDYLAPTLTYGSPPPCAWYTATWTCLACVAFLLFTSIPYHAQAQLVGLPLVVDEAPADTPNATNGQALRAALIHELQIPVTLAALKDVGVAREYLRVDLADPARVKLVFMPVSPKPPVSRTIDLSRNGPQAAPMLALVAANLMRDEASELLATLSAPPASPTTPAPTPPPAPAPPLRVEWVAGPHHVRPRLSCDRTLSHDQPPLAHDRPLM